MGGETLMDWRQAHNKWVRYNELGYFLIPDETLVSERFHGKVYSKGRPRFGKGHAFTPKNTRQFEARVADWLDGLGVGGITFPVSVNIRLYDPIPKSAPKWRRALMAAGVVTSTVGDLDNRAKSILDAMNEGFILDDSLINHLSVSRVYDEDEGFELTVTRNGFSAADIDMLGKAWKNMNS